MGADRCNNSIDMKKLILIVLWFVALGAFAQTSPSLPVGSMVYGNTYFLDTDGNVWAGSAAKQYRVVAQKSYVDSINVLGWSNAQIDSAISSKVAGYVPTSRTINGKALTSNITINASDVGLGNVNNTSDLNKPISNAAQTALDGKQDTSKLADPRQVSGGLKGGTIYFFGDSYTAGSGATSSDLRWTTKFAKYFGATEVNKGIAGATLMKRTPIDYMGADNMVDRVSEIPAKTAAIKMLVFAFGLNDMGQTAAAYTTANYKTDYATVINNAISKGWKARQILIVPPYYIGQDGYDRYAVITGNPAPTKQRHLSFIQASKEVAEQFGTMYWDIYNDQVNNNTTLLVSDGIHPNDAGYDYIFRSASTVFDNTDLLPITGGNMEGRLGFRNTYSNYSSLYAGDAGPGFMNLKLAPLISSGNVGQSLSIIPRGSGQSAGDRPFRTQLVLWNTDYEAVSPAQEGFVFRAAANYYELAAVAEEGGKRRPISISSRSEYSAGTPSLVVDTTGTVAINKKTGIDSDYALDISGDVLISGEIKASNVNVLTAQANLDFPSTPAGEATAIPVSVPGASVGDVVAIGVSATSDNIAYIFTAWVKATGSVYVKFINMTTAAIDPNPQVIKIRIMK